MTFTIIRNLAIIENLKQVNDILVVGDVGIDKYTFGNVTRISPEAPVPVLEVNKVLKKMAYEVSDLIVLFDDLFSSPEQENTRLVRGDSEPIYLPQSEDWMRPRQRRRAPD